jgi:Fic family protein
MIFSPLEPRDKQSNSMPVLQEKAAHLIEATAKLTGSHTPIFLKNVEKVLKTTNSYYSNLIEAQSTHPIEIERAIKNGLSSDERTANLQNLAIRYIEAQRFAVENYSDEQTLLTDETLLSLHKNFYNGDEMKAFRSLQLNEEAIEFQPGTYREHDVAVGAHIAPRFQEVQGHMNEYFGNYKRILKNHNGVDKLIAIMASHHRLVYIHPFLDGNGRISRILLDTLLRNTKIEGMGLWSMSRGLAKNLERYKEALKLANIKAQGYDDGRGPLSAKYLYQFCEFMLDVALDQAEYMHTILRLDKLDDRLEDFIFDVKRGRIELDGNQKLPNHADIVLRKLLTKGELARAEVVKLIGKSENTAKRAMSGLKKLDLIISDSNRAPIRLNITSQFGSRLFPDLIPDH